VVDSWYDILDYQNGLLPYAATDKPDSLTFKLDALSPTADLLGDGSAAAISIVRKPHSVSAVSKSSSTSQHSPRTDQQQFSFVSAF